MKGRWLPTRISALSLFAANTTGRLKIVTSPLVAAALNVAVRSIPPPFINVRTKSPSPAPVVEADTVALAPDIGCVGKIVPTPKLRLRSRRTSAITTSMSTWSGRTSTCSAAARISSKSSREARINRLLVRESGMIVTSQREWPARGRREQVERRLASHAVQLRRPRPGGGPLHLHPEQRGDRGPHRTKHDGHLRARPARRRHSAHADGGI